MTGLLPFATALLAALVLGGGKTSRLYQRLVVREQLATSLRPQLADCACAVGPAVPLAEVPGSLSLTLRLRRMAIAHRGPVFVDDYLLELACSAE